MSWLLRWLLAVSVLLLIYTVPSEAIQLFSGPAPSGTYGVVTTVTSGTGSAAAGAPGVLQVADNGGGLATFTGNHCLDSNTFGTGITPNGTLECAPVTVGTLAAPALLTTAHSTMPNGINLSIYGPGILAQTVTGGVATPVVLAQPAGNIVGTDAVQTLTHTRVDMRPVPVPTTQATVTLNVNDGDLFIISDLQQDTFFALPQGTLKSGQFLYWQVRTSQPRTFTWDPIWQGGAGFPLPSTVSGDRYWMWQYNATLGKIILLYDSSLATDLLTPVVTPGVYTCPTITVTNLGRITTIANGSCGGGGGGSATPAGSSGDVQYNNAGALGADTGNLTYDPLTKFLTGGGFQTPLGPSYQVFYDLLGTPNYLFIPSTVASTLAWDLPAESGTLCVKGGSCFSASGDFSSNTSTSVDGEIVLFSGTGGKTGKRATGSGIVTATSGVYGTVTAPTGAVVGTSDAQTFTNKTYDVEATGNSLTTVTKIWLPMAGCQGTTAGLLWDAPTSSPAVAACVTGTNTQKGVADFADGSNLSLQITTLLPADWSGNVDAKFKWFTPATTGSVVWQLATICVADAETDDPAFNTASTVTDAAKGTANQTNDATISNVTMTGCAAGELLHLKVFRDSAHASDNLADTARLIGVELTFRRTQ